MRTSIIVGYRFHSVLLADTLKDLGEDVDILSSIPSRRFRSQKFQHRANFVPLFASIANKALPLSLPIWTEQENMVFSRLASWRLGPADVVYGWAGYSLHAGRKAKSRGGAFVLERSCPHVLYQEKILELESEVLQIPYSKKSNRWIDFCLREYEEADFIVVPSQYTLSSFLERGFQEEKLVLAPLDKLNALPTLQPRARNSKVFTVGVLGGNVLRKGFLYMLEAWKKLRLPQSRLLIKADHRDLRISPVLSALIDSSNNVEFIEYQKDIGTFYNQCDLFVLPSIDDGFGLAALEALSYGIPTIVTSRVGAKDVLSECCAVRVAAGGSSDALASALTEFFRDSRSLEELGMQARNFVEKLVGVGGSRYEAAIRELYWQKLPNVLGSRRGAESFSSSELSQATTTL